MDKFLHHLNQALHDTNKVIGRFISFWLLSLVGLVVFCAIPILIVSITDNYDYAFFSVIPLSIIGLFLMITYKIYKEKPIFLYDPEYRVGMYDTEQKSLKQSVKEGVLWTLYAVFILIAAAFIAPLF